MRERHFIFRQLIGKLLTSSILEYSSVMGFGESDVKQTVFTIINNGKEPDEYV